METLITSQANQEIDKITRILVLKLENIAHKEGLFILMRYIPNSDRICFDFETDPSYMVHSFAKTVNIAPQDSHMRVYEVLRKVIVNLFKKSL